MHGTGNGSTRIQSDVREFLCGKSFILSHVYMLSDFKLNEAIRSEAQTLYSRKLDISECAKSCGPVGNTPSRVGKSRVLVTA